MNKNKNEMLMQGTRNHHLTDDSDNQQPRLVFTATISKSENKDIKVNT